MVHMEEGYILLLPVMLLTVCLRIVLQIPHIHIAVAEEFTVILILHALLVTATLQIVVVLLIRIHMAEEFIIPHPVPLLSLLSSIVHVASQSFPLRVLLLITTPLEEASALHPPVLSLTLPSSIVRVAA